MYGITILFEGYTAQHWFRGSFKIFTREVHAFLWNLIGTYILTSHLILQTKVLSVVLRMPRYFESCTFTCPSQVSSNFFTVVQCPNIGCKLVIDENFPMNVNSEWAINRLNLPIYPRSHPYRIVLDNHCTFFVTERCLVPIRMANLYHKNIWCDILPVNVGVSHILLGRPWIVDYNVTKEMMIAISLYIMVRSFH